jgi:hypothetical protein
MGIMKNLQVSHTKYQQNLLKGLLLINMEKITIVDFMAESLNCLMTSEVTGSIHSWPYVNRA